MVRPGGEKAGLSALYLYWTYRSSAHLMDFCSLVAFAPRRSRVAPDHYTITMCGPPAHPYAQSMVMSARPDALRWLVGSHQASPPPADGARTVCWTLKWVVGAPASARAAMCCWWVQLVGVVRGHARSCAWSFDSSSAVSPRLAMCVWPRLNMSMLLFTRCSHPSLICSAFGPRGLASGRLR